jgi:Protein of unknown function (DUF2490)
MIRNPTLITVLFAISALGAAAQTQDEFWPEVDLFVQTNEATRVVIKNSMNEDRDTDYREGTFGFFVEAALKPIFRRKLREREDVFRKRFLTFRGGYQYTNSMAAGDHNRESRGILEFTGRYPLPLQIVAIDRNRGEFRFIHGQAFSARYRNRLRLERDLKIGRFAITPFGYAEAFYNTRYAAWNQNRLAVGVEIPAGPHVVFQPHFIRQNDTRSDPTHVDALALTLNLYF